jgi:hypothetical protein
MARVGLTTFLAATTTTYARPTTDITTGGWVASGAASLAAALAEAYTSIDLSTLANITGAGTFEVKIGTLTDPGGATDTVVAYVLSGTGSASFQVDLVQGTSVIATFTETNVPTLPTYYEHSLTGAQVASITDRSDLRLRFTVQ